MNNRLKIYRNQLLDPFPPLHDVEDDLIILTLTKNLPTKPLGISYNTYTETLNILQSKYGSTDYNRLEFLGDAVLQLITSEILFDNFDLITAGNLTTMRSKMVRNTSLSCLTRNKNICDLVIGGNKPNGKKGQKTCADVFESIVGAVYYHLRQTNYPNIIMFIKEWLNQVWDYENILNYIINNPKIKDVCGVINTSIPTSLIESKKSDKDLFLNRLKVIMQSNGGWLQLSKLKKEFNDQGWGEPFLRGHSKLGPFLQNYRPTWVIMKLNGRYYLKMRPDVVI